MQLHDVKRDHCARLSFLQTQTPAIGAAHFQRMLLSSVAGLALLTSVSGSAWASCDFSANANANAICTGATTGDQNGNITVTTGARVDLTDSSGYSPAIVIITGTLNNHGTISATDTSGGGGLAYGLNSALATVNNFGRIEAFGDSAFGANAYDKLTVVNTGTISAVASGYLSGGVYNDFGDVVVTNSGTITAVAGYIASGVHAGNTATVVNTGVIAASNVNSNWAYGVDAGTAIVTNSGSITASNSAGGETYGVIAYNYAVVNNSGVIAATTDVSNSFGVYGAVTATVTNSGLISASTSAGGAAYGVSTSGYGSSYVTNRGTISAISLGVGDAVGVFGDNASSLLNFGTISGVSSGGTGYAIYYSYGQNTLALGAGSKLIGEIFLGSLFGPNTIRFLGGNHNLTFSAGDLAGATFTGSAVPYAVSGDRAAALDPTSFAASASMLLSTTRVIASLAPDFAPPAEGGEAAPVMAYAPLAEAPALPAGVMAFAADAPIKSQTVLTADGSAMWTRLFGGQSSPRAEGALVGYRNSFFGAAIGVDRPVDATLRYGAFVGVLNGASKLSMNYGDTDSRLGFAGVYGRKNWGASFLKLGLQTGFGSNDSTRNTNDNLAASGIATATGSYRNWYVSPELSMGHAFALGRLLNGAVSLTPTAQLRYVYGAFGGYSETGSTDALNVGNRTAQSLEERLSLKASHSSTILQGYELRIDVTGGVLDTQRKGADVINANLLGQQIQFAQPGKARTTAKTAGLGLELTKGALSLFVGGETIARPNAPSENAGRVGVSVRF